MQFLSDDELALLTGVTVDAYEELAEQLRNRPFHSLPADANQRTQLAREVVGRINSTNQDSQLFVRTLCWGVWSGEFPRIIERFRQSCGEVRPVSEAPNFLCSSDDVEDYEAWCIMGVLQLWDLHLHALGSQEGAYFSHDEWYATSWDAPEE